MTAPAPQCPLIRYHDCIYVRADILHDDAFGTDKNLKPRPFFDGFHPDARAALCEAETVPLRNLETNSATFAGGMLYSHAGDSSTIYATGSDGETSWIAAFYRADPFSIDYSIYAQQDCNFTSSII